MDTEKLEALERHIAQLIQAFTRVKEDNTRLAQHLSQLQQTVDEPQRALAHLQATQQEVTQLRTVIQALQREREFIRGKLEEMLVAIERLEGLSHVPSDSKI
jgi:predicted RNase H-like nuclease (RuvC/YqgF family)